MMQTKMLNELLKLTDLNTIARSKDCKVAKIERTNNGVTATVKNTKKNTTYSSSIFFDGTYSCTCPDFSLRRRFCKHLVALYKELKEDERRAFLEKRLREIKIKVPTTILSLNRLTGGGLPIGTVITVTGDPKVGKTFLVYQLACEISNLFRTPAIYIDTEGFFTETTIEDFRRYFSRYKNAEVIVSQIRDLQELAEFIGLKVHLNYTGDKINAAVVDIDSAAIELLRELNSKVLVIDSLSYPLKTTISTSKVQDYAARATIVNRMYGKLDYIASKIPAIVLVVQHISRNVINRSFKIYGGPSMLYAVKYCLHISKISDSKREIKRLIWPGMQPESITVEFKKDYGYV